MAATRGAVTVRKGTRGTVWSIRFADASAKMIYERLGTTAEGWNRRKAKAVLAERIVAVRKAGYRKATKATFETFALEWVEAYPSAKGLKASTTRSYRDIVHRVLIPAFGRYELHQINVERIEAFLAVKAKAGLAPGTRNRFLNVLRLIMRAAQRRSLIVANPVSLVDRPRERMRAWRIFGPTEVAAIERAFTELLAEAEADKAKHDLTVTRALFVFHMGTGCRRGEAAGLRWRSVFLADPHGAYLKVEETFVLNRIESPKSDAGRRTIDLGAHVAAMLFDHRAWSAYAGDDEYVFAARTGSPFDPCTFSDWMKKARLRAGITEACRPSHDLRHSSITNAARAGTSPEALMQRSGHSSYATTRRYIHLAGARFADEAAMLEERLWPSAIRST